MRVMQDKGERNCVSEGLSNTMIYVDDDNSPVRWLVSDSRYINCWEMVTEQRDRQAMPSCPREGLGRDQPVRRSEREMCAEPP